MFQNKNDSEWIGRQSALEQMVSTLEDRSVLLTGPRRIGKTELLKHLAAAASRRWKAVRVDVSSVRTTGEGVARIVSTLRDNGLGPSAAGEQLGRIQGLEAAGFAVSLAESTSDDVWQRLGSVIKGAIGQLDAETRLVLALDEVPWWIAEIRKTEGDDAARTVLAGLRYLRQRDDLESRTRWILTGSVGLAGVARAIGASAEINDLNPFFPLGPLDEHFGRTLFEMRVIERQLGCDPAAAALGAREAGGSPHWIRWLAQRAANHPASTSGGLCVSIQSVKLALGDIEHPRLGSDLFEDEGRVHLRKYHGDEGARVMSAILMAAAESEDGLTEAAAQALAQSEMSRPDRAQAREWVFALIDAWYLDWDHSQRLSFVNPLFRRWFKRFGGQ